VKKAMLFGASAIIILTMNPNILQQVTFRQAQTNFGIISFSYIFVQIPILDYAENV